MPDQLVLSPKEQVAPVPPSPPAERQMVVQRLGSVDGFRGLVLFLMIAEIFLQLHAVAKALPQSRFWQFLGHNQLHVEWAGASLHDLIHPSFTFLVGVALPFSLAHRLARGENSGRLIAHAAWRSLLLVALGVFLRSVGKPRTYFIFMDTLTQIGLGYFPLFLIGMAIYHPDLAKKRGRAFGAALPCIALVVILVGDWAAFALYPLPGPDFDYEAVGVHADWPHHFTGFAAHWNKNSNLGTAFDYWFLNLFPQYDGRPFIAHPGGYSTLNFIPHLGTMLLGLIAGGWLKALYSHLGDHSHAANGTENGPEKAGQIGVRRRQDTLDPHTSGEVLLRLVVTGILCLALSLILQELGICPIVKRLWTPAWVLFSGGWCFLALAGFYYVMDVRGYQAWAFPLTVLGMNSIAVYCLADVGANFLLDSSQTHLGFALGVFGNAYEPLLRGLPALAAFWLFFCWLYRRRIFVKL
jgi:heparan-alpha-glucosaminide N-acetyltransferase